MLLLRTGEKLFKEFVPFLILLASVLLAVQGPVRAWLTRRMEAGAKQGGLERWTWLPVGLASVYGGYFGAGLSVIVLSALGITLEDSLTRLNALEAGSGFLRQCGRGGLLYFLGEGAVARGRGDGGGRAVGRRAGRQAGRPHPALCAALDGGRHRSDRGDHLFHSRLRWFALIAARWHEDGRTCEDDFHTLLGWETQYPGYGVVHHLLVLCYHLQHPSLYSPQGLTSAKGLLMDFLVKGKNTEQVRRENRSRLDSANRTWKVTGRERSHGSFARPVAWSMTIADIARAGPEVYIANMRDWAASILRLVREAGEGL